MVSRQVVRALTLVASVALAGCITPAEPRLTKLGAYQVKMDFTEETFRDDIGGHFTDATDGSVLGMLVIRERTTGPSAGSGLAVEAEMVMVSCSGLSGEFCGYSTRFKSDTIWGGAIDTPSGGEGHLQLLLDGGHSLYIELDGAFEGGEFRGTALWRNKGICCGTPTVDYARGTFRAAK